MAQEIFKRIVSLRDNLGLTLVVVEQAARRALEIGDKAYLLVSGRTIYEGEAQDLLNNPELGKLYLGIRK